MGKGYDCDTLMRRSLYNYLCLDSFILTSYGEARSWEKLMPVTIELSLTQLYDA